MFWESFNTSRYAQQHYNIQIFVLSRNNVDYIHRALNQKQSMYGRRVFSAIKINIESNNNSILTFDFMSYSSSLLYVIDRMILRI